MTTHLAAPALARLRLPLHVVTSGAMLPAIFVKARFDLIASAKAASARPEKPERSAKRFARALAANSSPIKITTEHNRCRF